jgi:2-C-methyl-D-erythritol 4-phosphate cytidylyltransferase
MKSLIPKQFLLICDEPVLAHTLRKFADCEIVLVLPKDHIPTWELSIKKLKNLPSHRIVEGGKTRSESVSKGLEALADQQGLVAVHDAVRPLVSKDLIEKCFASAQQYGSGVAAVPLKESIRFVDKETFENYAVDRESFWLMQTPQTFTLELLRQAFALQNDFSATDEASLVEHTGHNLRLVESSYENLKITNPEDLSLAEVLWKNSNLSQS